MRTLLDDLSFGLRLLKKNPSGTALAVFTLALGISANTTVVGWIDSILLHPLPGVQSADRLAVLEATMPNGEIETTSVVEYRHYRDNLKLISGLAASHQDAFTFGPAANGPRIWGELVSSNYFDVLGVKPILGRTFAAGEFGDGPDSVPTVVLSESLWHSRFRRDPGVIGKTIRLNRRELTVIGVIPGAFRGIVNGLKFEFWAPLPMAKELSIWNEAAFRYRGSRGLNCIARLKPGVSIAQAAAELASAGRQLDAISSEVTRGYGGVLSPLWKAHYGAADLLDRPLRILMLASWVMLLIVCANVANLLLARATTRQREFSVRLALGASRMRIVRQLLTEALVLSAAGALFALPMALWLRDSLVWLIPQSGYPVALAGQLNGRDFAVTALICTVAALVSGIAPALVSVKSDVNSSLREGGRTGQAGRRSHRFRDLLVVSEVALASLALVGAGLFIRSFENARNIRPGFDATNVLLTQLQPSGAGYNARQSMDFCRRLRARLEAAPGIATVAYADSAPLGFSGTAWQHLALEGYTPSPSEDMKLHRTLISPGYFSLLRIPVLAGRDFTDLDGPDSPKVMIVNQTFATRFYGARGAIGRKINVEGMWFTVVGMVRDSKYHKAAESPQPFFFIPFQQYFNTGLSINVFVRTPGDPLLATTTMRQELAALDPNVGAILSTPLSAFSAASLYPQKVAASLLAAVGLVSLLLAALGLYCVMSYSVTQRTQEIGIRMAMGARPVDVLRQVIHQGLALTFAGLAAGMIIARAATPLIGSMLVKMSPSDPATFLASAVFLTAVATLAAFFPSRRATRVDPMVALRWE